MDAKESLQIETAEEIRAALIKLAVEKYEDASIAGLCAKEPLKLRLTL